MEEFGIRINKYLADSGICSRREADRRIEEGNVTIDGRIATAGDRVMPGQRVMYCGVPARLEEEKILLAFYKPVGIVCTAEKREKDNVIDFLNYPKRIYPVGRLDKDSEGLLLLTNQGEIVNKMMRSGNMHEKEYIVTLTRPVSESLVRGLANGVPLVDLGVTTRRCFVEQISKFQLRIILTQGYNRQIRRMCDYFGYHVKSLKRVRVMNIELGDLLPGQYRPVTPEEYDRLMWLIRNSSNAPVEKEETGFRRPNSEKMRRPQERPNAGRPLDRPYERKPQERPYERKTQERPFEGRSQERPTRPTTGRPQERPTTGRPQERPTTGRPQERPNAGRPQERPTAGRPQEHPTTGRPQERPVENARPQGTGRKTTAFRPEGTLSPFEERQRLKRERQENRGRHE